MVGPDPLKGNSLRLSTSPTLDERRDIQVAWFYPHSLALTPWEGDMIVEHILAAKGHREGP
jgi:hypothetical protein